MKVFAIGAPFSMGVSTKKDPKGRAYDIRSLSILMPIEPGTGSGENGTWERGGYGYQVSEIPVHEDKFEIFADVAFPCDLDVATDTQMSFGRMQTVVIGINGEYPKIRKAKVA